LLARRFSFLAILVAGAARYIDLPSNGLLTEWLDRRSVFQLVDAETTSPCLHSHLVTAQAPRQTQARNHSIKQNKLRKFINRQP